MAVDIMVPTTTGDTTRNATGWFCVEGSGAPVGAIVHAQANGSISEQQPGSGTGTDTADASGNFIILAPGASSGANELHVWVQKLGSSSSSEEAEFDYYNQGFISDTVGPIDCE